MKRALVALAVIGLTLTGCAAEQTQANEPTEATSTASQGETTPSPTDSPVDAGPVEVTMPPETDPTADELRRDWYGAAMRTIATRAPDAPHMTSDDLYPAGQYICDQYRAGVPIDEISAFEGFGTNNDLINRDIVGHTLFLYWEEAQAPENPADYAFCEVAFPAS